MMQTGMNLKNMKVPTVSSGMIGGVMFFLVILTILYYAYIFLYNSASVESSFNIIPSNVTDKSQLKNGGVIRCDAFSTSATASNGNKAVANLQNATGLTSGGQYTVTMWLSVYSTSPQTSGTGTIHLLDITSSAKTLLYMGLTPTNGTLVVRQGTADPGNDGVPTITASMTPATTATFVNSDRCNIANAIEYQRWVLLGVIANGRTLDVYVDGKLSRSCVYSGINDLGVTTGVGEITVGRQSSTTGTINGVFSTVEYYNYALSPATMWSIYQNGPATSSTASFFTGLLNTNIDLSMGTAATS
jgi:hypothetical protein